MSLNKISTIQKRENLNYVFSSDEIGVGNAHHKYVIQTSDGDFLTEVKFQRGARKDPAADHGILDSDLLEIVRDRISGFQEGEYKTRENAIALTHIEEALLWMNKRVEDRIERNVLGTYNK